MYFHDPLFFILLIFPLAFFLYSIQTKKVTPTSFFAPAVLQTISVHPKITSTTHKYRLLLFVSVLFIIALARPVTLTQAQNKSQKSIPLLIALDISKSMLKDDFYPSRLEFALSKIEFIMNSESNLRVGLVVFAKDAYVAHPLSEDKASLLFIAQNIAYSEVVKDGTNLFAPLEAAATLLKSYTSKNLLIITDAQSTQALQDEYLYANKEHLKLTILHISKEHSTFLDSLSEGNYYPADYSSESIYTILKNLQSENRTIKDPNRVQQHKELFFYPLVLALFILLYLYGYSTQRQVKTPILLLLVLFLYQPTKSSASLVDVYYLYNATEAYREQRYDRALEHYFKALGDSKRANAMIYYNIANSYVKKEQLQLAKKYYKKSIALAQDSDAVENLEKVMQILANQKHKKAKEKKDKYKLPERMLLEQREPSEALSSNYTVKLGSMVLGEEERILQKVTKQKPLIFLRKLHTTKRSKYVMQD